MAVFSMFPGAAAGFWTSTPERVSNERYGTYLAMLFLCDSMLIEDLNVL